MNIRRRALPIAPVLSAVAAMAMTLVPRERGEVRMVDMLLSFPAFGNFAAVVILHGVLIGAATYMLFRVCDRGRGAAVPTIVVIVAMCVYGYFYFNWGLYVVT